MTSQTRPTRVFASRGQPQVGSLTSAERGVLTTAVCCMSASGQFIPPFLLFPRARMNSLLLEGAPPGTKGAVHPSGWMQTEIFVSWFDHFLQHTKPSEIDPVLLVLDGHMTHTKNLALVQKAREHHVTIIVLPPHCTHKMQPLDVSFMFPLNTFYTKAVETWLRNNPGKVVSIYQVGKLFGEAYLRASAPTTAINGFKKTGICPCDRNVFADADFVAAEVTSQPEPFRQPEEQEAIAPAIARPNESSPPQPSSSSGFLDVSAEEIMPLPKAPMKSNTEKHKRRGKAAIITSSPYQKELKEEGLAKRKKAANQNATKKAKRRRVSNHPAFSASCESEALNVDDDTKCLFCHELYSKSACEDGWVQCRMCKKWAHEACSHIDEEDDDFTCDFCR